ncbi:hypothetical protein PR003_g22170 [Phytophthora rubi]|uniref:Uncharacterized protein n=1 Tax=Phytophthora rubi TaxID=129364 RepID=A0A6A3LEA6_9STRA|nr:hypothetical protein PR001_g21031 [Phytophthora rubi]KAE9016920.1 hypothetical protein PR002_g13541 [Phytophthora rubi]KAE9302778.1 hypothetical protein PR003_g22170 [Phytophthora rubi]
MRAHNSPRQSVASVDDVGSAEHGHPEIRLVGKGMTSAHGASANTFPLPRSFIVFFVLRISNRSSVLPTDHSLGFSFFMSLVSTSLFLANALALLSRFTFISGLELSVLLYS